jgi:pre-mRNA-splicing helicase BRR2
MLGFIQSRFGDVGTDILRGAAEEALAILKNDALRDPIKQKELNKLFGSDVNDVQFHELVTVGKAITDFVVGENEKDDNEPSSSKVDMGVAVVVDEDDEDSDGSDLDVVRDSDDEDDEGGVEANMSSKLTRTDGVDNDNGEEADSSSLNVHDIDAYWLQRQLSTWFTDAQEAQRVADQTLALLQIKDERDCENKLVLLLEFDKFDFIKLILKNRAKIVYCTRLKQAQSDLERMEIESEMMNDDDRKS